MCACAYGDFMSVHFGRRSVQVSGVLFSFFLT